MPCSAHFLASMAMLLALATALPVNHTRVAMPTTLADLPDAAAHAHISRVLDDGSSHKLIILVTVNTGYLDFFRNWLHYYRKLGLGMYLVIAEDRAAFQTLYDDPDMNLKGRVLYAGDDERVRDIGNISDPETAYSFGMSEFNVLVQRRPTYFSLLLNLGYDVLYSDVDTIWLQDPLPYMTNHTFTIHVQSDSASEREKPSSMACTGFIMLTSTPQVRELVFLWNKVLSVRRGTITNQLTFSSLLTVTISQGKLKAFFLPYTLFPNGALYFDKQWRERLQAAPVLVHNNWIMGHDEKRERFQELGLWHPV